MRRDAAPATYVGLGDYDFQFPIVRLGGTPVNSKAEKIFSRVFCCDYDAEPDLFGCDILRT